MKEKEKRILSWNYEALYGIKRARQSLANARTGIEQAEIEADIRMPYIERIEKELAELEELHKAVTFI